MGLVTTQREVILLLTPGVGNGVSYYTERSYLLSEAQNCILANMKNLADISEFPDSPNEQKDLNIPMEKLNLLIFLLI